MTPRDHKSAVWLYGCSRTNSGAMYKGVPCMNLKPSKSEAINQEVLYNCNHNSNATITRFHVDCSPFMDLKTTVFADIARAKPKSHSCSTNKRET